MEVAIKVKGITKRWIFNVILIVITAVLILIVTLGITISNYYYEGVSKSVETITYSFDKLIMYDSDNFRNEARLLAEQFPYKDKVEIQILDSSGKVVVSTNGFLPEQEKMPDYVTATQNDGRTGRWIGKNSAGEKVMAYSSKLADYGTGSNGAVRCLVSLARVDRQIVFSISIIIAVGLAVIIFAFCSGVYFINSIVKPVREVGNIARRIAMGDFKARIDVKENDEIGELCDTINYMASELGEAENMKNDFISSVSHELRTPLTAIKGWGETVKGAINSDRALVTKGIDIIIGESERLSGLVEELLDFSRMQSGRLAFKMERLDILAELGEAVYIYEEAARRGNILLTYHEPESVSPVIGDGDKLEQVFINIVDNAIKYTNPGGVVNVDAIEEEGCVRITITDTGVGIPAQNLDRVKEKFYKANKSVRGSGIGLAVADEIVKQHNGLLFLESKEGIGTTVTVVLPTEVKPEPKSLPQGDINLSRPTSQTLPNEKAAEDTDADEKESTNEQNEE